VVEASVGFKALGVMFCLAGRGEAELQNRIARAWAKFHEIWLLLSNRNSSLRKRLQLFSVVVGRSALWGSESWTLTRRQKERLQAVQRRMLRRFAGRRRQPDEDWVTWIRQSTHMALNAAAAAGTKGWIQEHLARKWQWAGHVARMAAYRESSWTFKLTVWRDSYWMSMQQPDSAEYSSRPLRARAGRFRRWEHEAHTFASLMVLDVAWVVLAQDKKSWNDLTSAFTLHAWK